MKSTTVSNKRDKMQSLTHRSLIEKYGVEKITKKRKRIAECLSFDSGIYTGEYVRLEKSVLRHGIGEFIYRDGVVYTGRWHCNDRSGSGVLVWSSGDRFECEWHTDSPEGTGKFFFRNAPPCEEFITQGLVLRLADLLCFDSYPDVQKEIRGEKKLPIHQCVNDWLSVVISSGEDRPDHNLFTSEWVRSWVDKIWDSQNTISLLCDFLEKWYTKLEVSEVVVAIPDLDSGDFLSLHQVIVSSRLFQSYLTKYLSFPEQSSLLIRVMDISLPSKLTLAILELLRSMPSSFDVSIAYDVISRSFLPMAGSIAFVGRSKEALESSITHNLTSSGAFAGVSYETLMRVYINVNYLMNFSAIVDRMWNTLRESKLGAPEFWEVWDNFFETLVMVLRDYHIEVSNQTLGFIKSIDKLKIIGTEQEIATALLLETEVVNLVEKKVESLRAYEIPREAVSTYLYSIEPTTPRSSHQRFSCKTMGHSKVSSEALEDFTEYLKKLSQRGVGISGRNLKEPNNPDEWKGTVSTLSYRPLKRANTVTSPEDFFTPPTLSVEDTGTSPRGDGSSFEKVERPSLESTSSQNLLKSGNGSSDMLDSRISGRSSGSSEDVERNTIQKKKSEGQIARDSFEPREDLESASPRSSWEHGDTRGNTQETSLSPRKHRDSVTIGAAGKVKRITGFDTLDSDQPATLKKSESMRAPDTITSPRIKLKLQESSPNLTSRFSVSPPFSPREIQTMTYSSSKRRPTRGLELDIPYKCTTWIPICHARCKDILKNLRWVRPLFKSGYPPILSLVTTGLEKEPVNTIIYRSQLSSVLAMLWTTLLSGWPTEQLYKLRAACLWVLSQFAQTSEGEDAETYASRTKKEIIGFGLKPVSELLSNSRIFVQSDALEILASLTSGEECFRDSVISEIGIDIPIEKLKNGKSSSVCLAAARLVANLCYSEIHREKVCSQGALPHLLDYTKQGQVQISKSISREEIELEQVLGRGTFAVVHEGLYKGKKVAIKVFREESLEFRLEDFYKEVAIMCVLKHPHVLVFEGACIQRSRNSSSVFMIVTELMEKGSLKSIIKDKPLPLRLLVKYSLHVSSAMAYIHSLNIIHRDLKCDNILVSGSDFAKVADMGLARQIDIDGMTMLAGTPKWEAPEVLVMKKGKRNYSTMADVYSFGIAIYEMVTGKDPFPEIHDIFELKKHICDRHKRPHIAKNLPPILRSMMKAMWDKNPSKRPSFHNVELIFRKMSEDLANQNQ
eukprot:TRINITY_DN6577_c0_g1_i2.p1 TRINITY_DN6577_c0_g1~~TRINITY_DN6577_c0_g1_i2.p1  ORF type:complete len:1240 (+),score=182.23 TRINITY_DN6577_c0_g1_i2:71-3790(+)